MEIREICGFAYWKANHCLSGLWLCLLEGKPLPFWLVALPIGRQTTAFLACGFGYLLEGKPLPFWLVALPIWKAKPLPYRLMSEILSDFQKFLISRKHALSENARFYAYWVNSFFLFSRDFPDLSFQAMMAKFTHSLRIEETADWKIKQAERAIKLYMNDFLNPKRTNFYSGSPARELEGAHIIDSLREAIRLKHYSYSTERSYIDWVKRFFHYLTKIKNKNISSLTLDASDIRDYLTHLAVKQRVSSSTQNQAFNALLFLFRDVLKKEVDGLDKTVRAKRGPKLPVVLTVDEVKALFQQVEGENLLIFRLLYGSGLRLMEAARLRVKDIDFDNNLIFVRGGKQDKDRATILALSVKESLKKHLEEVEELHKKDVKAGYGEVYLPDGLERKFPNAAKEWGWQYVFPAKTLSVDPRGGKVRRHHIHPTSIQKTMKNIARKAGLVKNATVHTLRHSFATHLLINGVNIREIQELLGHKNVETTMVYTHVLRNIANAPKSPLDSLYANNDRWNISSKKSFNKAKEIEYSPSEAGLDFEKDADYRRT